MKEIINKINSSELDKLLIEYNKNKDNPRIIKSRRLTKKLTFESYNYGKFIVLDKVEKNNKGKNYYNYYRVQFIETGYIANKVELKSIQRGDIKDYLYKSLKSIGYLGEDYKQIQQHDPILCKYLYNKWTRMIDRCYNSSNTKYQFYGGKNVTVDNNWLCFCNYYNDVTGMSSFDKDLVLSQKLTLDKDKLQINIENKVYSKNTCCWLSMKEQGEYRDNEKAKDKYKKIFVVTFPDNHTEVHKCIRKFCRKYNLDQANVTRCFNGRQKSHKDYKFRFADELEINKYFS